MSSTPIHPNVNAVSSSFPAVLLDAYGVFWGGNQTGLLPGAKETMSHLVSQGKIVGILSNTTQLVAKEIRKLQAHGLEQGQHFHFLLTSGEIGRAIFLNDDLPFPSPQKTFYLLGGLHPRFSSHQAIFEGTIFHETPHLAEADFIYISIPHLHGEDQTDPEVFREQIIPLIGSNSPMICPNPDRFAHEGSPPKAVVRQGSIAAIYEELGGQVFYIGKPHSMVYEAAMEQFTRHNITKRSDVLMVGDTPETDIRGAQQFGMPAALVTHTGIMADRIDTIGFDSAIKQLTSHETPNFFIGTL